MDFGIIFQGFWSRFCSSICRMPTPPGTKRNNGKRHKHADNCRNMQKPNATKKALIKLQSITSTSFMPQTPVLCPSQQFYAPGTNLCPRHQFYAPGNSFMSQAAVLWPGQEFYAPGSSFMPRAIVLCPRHQLYAPGTSFMPQSAVLVFDVTNFKIIYLSKNLKKLSRPEMRSFSLRIRI